MKLKIICAAVIIAACFLLVLHCGSPLAGNGSQTPNGTVSAMVYNPGGSPAANTKVCFYPRDYDPHTGQGSGAADSTYTDTNGNYTAMLDTGKYTVFANGDSGMAYQDSIRAIGGHTIHPPVCTLKTPGTIRGVVQLEQGDDPRTVFILFLGTHSYTTPDDAAGNFISEPMAGGKYRVRILTTIPDYQVMDTSFTITAGRDSVMADTIRLKYTGIPIPKGLSASYDTVHGIVTLRWNRVTFLELQGYIVYRNDTAATLPERISGNSAITDTFFNDTVFLDLLDTNTFVYEYRVKVQDTSANIGNKFSAPCEVTAASPTKVRTFINLQTLNTISDTASINDSVKIIASYQNQTRKNSRISWYVGRKDSLVKGSGISSRVGNDTLMNIWRTPGVKKVFVKIQDTAGTVWEDSITVTIVLDAPVAEAGNDTMAPVNGMVRMHGSATQQFGSIVKWEWKFGSGNWITTGGPDTVVVMPSTEQIYACSLAVTDDDGNRGVGEIKIAVVVMGKIKLAAGWEHSLIVKNDGTLWACGLNECGQLGDGTTTNRLTPVQVMSNVHSVAAGPENSLIVKNDGTLWACGGSGVLAPVQVMSSIQCVASGNGYTPIVKIDGTLWLYGRISCWFGDGPATNYLTPVQAMSNVQSVAAGSYAHSLILKTDATLWACGWNDYGQLGDGTTTTQCPPVQVMSNVQSAATGFYYSLILKTDGTLWACGNNGAGQLGTGDTIDRHTPVQVMSNVQSMAGFYHSLILKTDGTLWACGWNYYGQLGDGTTISRSTPVQVMSNVQSMAAGSAHSLIVKNDGTLWACGWNYYGQLGDGTTTDRHTPVQIILP
jgi:alpha-tubulin suppressor-like RCC1 family protein